MTLATLPAAAKPRSDYDSAQSNSALRASRTRRDIQGLRAVAVLLVVLYHARLPGVRAGYVGVDVFFVISGFLITGQISREIIRTGRFGLFSFYGRRMRRLLPTAMFVLVVTVLAGWLFGPILQVKSTAKDALFCAIYGINFRLASEGVNYQQANGPLSPLQHYWSLAVEEQFYLVWPIIAIAATLCFARRRPQLVTSALFVVATLGTATSLWACVVVTRESAPTAYFSVGTRAWEFGFGAMLALSAGAVARLPRWITVLASWVGLALIVGSAFAYSDATAFPGTAALVPVVGAVLLVGAGARASRCEATAVDPAGAGRLLAVRPAQWVGRVSYSWYLWHWPMLVLAPSLLGYSLSWIRGLEISVLALWAAGLTYAIIERPTQRAPFRTGRWLSAGVGLSGVALLVGSFVFVNSPSVTGDGSYAKRLVLGSSPTSQLHSALVAASNRDSVPGNLTPSLEDAADDVPVTETNCHLGFLAVHEGRCIFADPGGSHTVVVFGDSHAQQWDGAVIAAALRLHWRVVSWTKSACPFADVSLINPELERPYSECSTWRAQTIKRIRRLHPALVLASQSDSVPGQGLTNRRWAARTAFTAARLREKGTKVIFLSDTPYPIGDVPTCVAANLDHLPNCVLPRRAAYHDSALYTSRHALVTRTLRADGTTVIDPLDWLCSPTSCPVIVDDVLVYRDDSHISNTYSKALGPIFVPILRAALNGRSK